MTTPLVPSITDEQLEAIEPLDDNERCDISGATLRAIISRLRAAERDAGRYRWLRNQGESFQWYNITRVDPDDFASLDDCIDAAMQEHNQ
jgi:hypothetical protein